MSWWQRPKHKPWDFCCDIQHTFHHSPSFHSHARRHRCLSWPIRALFMKLTWYQLLCDLETIEIMFCRSYLRWPSDAAKESWLTNRCFRTLKDAAPLMSQKDIRTHYKIIFWRICIFPLDSELCYIATESITYCSLNKPSYTKVSEAVTFKTHYAATLSAAWDSPNSRLSLCQSIFYLLNQRSLQKRKFNSAKWNPSDIEHETSKCIKQISI